jgi:hypothetical protein
LRSNYEQLKQAMSKAGYITEEEFAQDIARLDDPSLLMPSPVLGAAGGRRPLACDTHVFFQQTFTDGGADDQHKGWRSLTGQSV